MTKKLNQKRLTVILVPESTAEPKSLSISMNVVKVGIITVGILLVLGITAGIIYFQSRHDLAAVQAIKTDNQEKTQQVQELSHRLLELEKENEKINKEQKRLKQLIGTEPAERQKTPSRGGSRQISLIDTADLSAKMVALKVIFNEQAAVNDKLIVVARSKSAWFRDIPNRWPLRGNLTSPFGQRVSPFSFRRETFHNGLDIAAPRNTSICAAADGTVIYSDWAPIYGRLIKIKHKNGLVTWYGHNAKLLVEVGDKVAKGQKIAKVGSSGHSTGPHLHYLVEKQGIPVDPKQYLP